MQHNPQFLALVEHYRKEIKQCSIEEVKQWREAQKPMVLIDNREQSEWLASRIPHAQYLGRGVMERDIESHYPDVNTFIVVYCGGGFRSALSVYNLQLMGYKNVWSMDGGIRAWQAAGFGIDESPVVLG